jgi:hypothetical protein
MDLKNDMDLMLVHLLLLDVVQNLDDLDRLLLLDVVHPDVQQNLDEVSRDVVHLDVQHPLVAEVDAELHHLLRMDYFQDAVDVGPLLLLKMDCYLDEEQLVHLELVEWLEPLVILVLLQLQQLQPVLLRVMPSTLRDQHRARQQVQLRVLDLPPALLQQLFWLQLSLQASSLQLALHRDRAQLTCGQPVAQLLMMLIGRIRRALVTLQGLPCFPYRVVLPTHVHGPLTHFSCLGPQILLWDASPSCRTS